KGFGQDRVVQSDSAAQRTDVVEFTDLSSEDLVSVTRSGSHLSLNFADGDSVQLDNFYQGDSYGQYKIDKIKFTDVEWSRNDLISAQTRLSEGNDTVTASSLAGAHIDGLAGNDAIQGGSLADTLKGGE